MRLPVMALRHLHQPYKRVRFFIKLDEPMSLEKEISPETKSIVSEGEEKTNEFQKLKWLHALDKLGVEERGIERVTPEERLTGPVWRRYVDVLGLWFAGCGGITTMSSFFYPTLAYGLDMKQSLIAGLIGMNIGCLVPAYCATMGPKSGCRQMVTARFLFGQWGAKFIALVCILGGLGWSVVNCVVGGQMLSAISGTPLSTGIIVVVIVSWVIAVFGIRVLLPFQTTVAVPTNIAILLFYVVVGKKTSYISLANQMTRELGLSASTITGNWLSYFTITYSTTASWGSCASDYYILFPDNTSDVKIFWITFFGIAVPSNFAAIVGTLAGSIAYSNTDWMKAYEKYSVGGIIAQAFDVWGNFGKFVVVVLYISLMCNTIINTYSCAFQFQLVDMRLAYVPRWIWATVISAIFLAVSLAGREHLSDIISTVLPMLGYWISIYICLLVEENVLFRRRNVKEVHHLEFAGDEKSKLYSWDKWDKPQHRTAGYACALSFCFGVVGAVMGMNQVYYIGPIAKKIGSYGGDIGMWLAIAFSGVTYPGLRWYELKKMGR